MYCQRFGFVLRLLLYRLVHTESLSLGESGLGCRADVSKEMADLMREKPRSEHEILERFAGQPNHLYTFSDTDFVYGDGKDSASKTAKSVGA